MHKTDTFEKFEKQQLLKQRSIDNYPSSFITAKVRAIGGGGSRNLIRRKVGVYLPRGRVSFLRGREILGIKRTSNIIRKSKQEKDTCPDIPSVVAFYFSSFFCYVTSKRKVGINRYLNIIFHQLNNNREKLYFNT